MDNLYALFEQQVDRCGEKLAIQFRPRYRTLRLSYRELQRQVVALAHALGSRNIGPGDRVLLYALHSPLWIAAYYAILARGAAVVPLNPQSTTGQLDRIVAVATPALVLYTRALPWPATPLPGLELEAKASEDAAASEVFPGRNTPAEDLAEIVYTSGTTGEPKGVMLTHANLLANLAAIKQAIPLRPTDHILCIVPLFHMYGQMTSMLYPMSQGNSASFLVTPTTRGILEFLAYTPATHLIVVPEFLKTFMERLEAKLARVPMPVQRLFRRQIRQRISKTLHTFVSGGAPLAPAVEQEWRKLGYDVLQGYGLTETSPGVAFNTHSEHRIGTVGKPLMDVQVRLQSDGELLVRGPNVTSGYFRDPEHTRAAFTDGWFKTGDTGKLDEDGFLYILGRKKYLILGPGGENVFPEDIEVELNKVSGVIDSTVVGLEEGGRAIIQAVLLMEAGDAEAVVAEANRHLAPHQRIMRWSLWPDADFPRSATRKVKKDDVIKRLQTVGTVATSTTATVTPLNRLLADLAKTDPRTVHGTTRIIADLHLDSLLRIELVSAIEERFNVVIEENQITLETTVADLEVLVRRQRGRAPRIVTYPRWSSAPWAAALRPHLQKLLFYSWLTLLCRFRIRGLEYLENLSGPVIFMPNHRSYLDGLVAAYALPARFQSKLGIAAAIDTLYQKFWWFAPLAELGFNTYPFATNMNENIQPSLHYTGRHIDDGGNILVFPEGQINSRDLSLQSLKTGAGMLAVEMQVPIVPMAILGTERILPARTLIPRRRDKVEIRFGIPIMIQPDTSYSEATLTIERAMCDLLDGA